MNDNIPKKLLQETKRVLIEKGWTQGSFAKTADAFPVNWSSEDAVSFCLMGAFNRASHDLLMGDYGDEYYDARRAAVRVVCAVIDDGHYRDDDGHEIHTILGFNDVVAKTRDDVVTLLEKAEARL